ncbi:MAG: hypothetical protein H0X02_08755 [Nitrosomonas sp.]|nr:hypothetical protein [Nitrosomonas sp.]
MAGRKREVILDEDEDIVAYEHNLAGGFVRALVGYGTKMPDGSFIPSDGQNFENIIIQGPDYVDLMAETETKPANVFRRDDLWVYVDIARTNFLAEREKIRIATEEKLEAKQILAETKNVKPKNNT